MSDAQAEAERIGFPAKKWRVLVDIWCYCQRKPRVAQIVRITQGPLLICSHTRAFSGEYRKQLLAQWWEDVGYGFTVLCGRCHRVGNVEGEDLERLHLAVERAVETRASQNFRLATPSREAHG